MLSADEFILYQICTHLSWTIYLGLFDLFLLSMVYLDKPIYECKNFTALKYGVCQHISRLIVSTYELPKLIQELCSSSVALIHKEATNNQKLV